MALDDYIKNNFEKHIKCEYFLVFQEK